MWPWIKDMKGAIEYVIFIISALLAAFQHLIILAGISHELCCRAECMCTRELYATADVWGVLCRVSNAGEASSRTKLSGEASGNAVGLRGIHIWTHCEWKDFKHETRPAGSSIRRWNDEHHWLCASRIRLHKGHSTLKDLWFVCLHQTKQCS